VRIFIFCLLVFGLQCFANHPQALKRAKNTAEWEKQKTFFEENGYLWIKNFYSPEQVLLLDSLADEIHNAGESLLALKQKAKLSENLPGTLIVVSEAQNPLQVCRTEDMLSFYPELHHLVQGTLIAFIGRLLGEPCVLFKDKLNFKWPGGGAFPPHQDFPAFEFFGPREHITAMVSIDEADFENGCLQVAKDWRGTFRGEAAVDAELLQVGRAVLPYIEGGSNHGSIQPEYVEKIDWLPIIASPGDLVIFDSFLPHFSEPNKSERSRRAMFFTLNRLKEGDFNKTYYHAKRHDPLNPAFHFATPTNARTK